MKADKIRGPDGLAIEFYIGFMDILEDDILEVTEKFRVRGRILGSFKITFIVLILKKDTATTLNNFHLISLCNVVYKLIEKVISNKVKDILTYLIRDEQFAFLAKKQIHEPIAIA